MATKIYIENLPSEITEERLKDFFSQIGDVQSVKIRADLLTRLTSHPTGSGIVEMSLDVDAFRAINCFEGATFKDKRIHVKEAYPIFEKAKNIFDHITDGYSFDNFIRWKEDRKNNL